MASVFSATRDGLVGRRSGWSLERNEWSRMDRRREKELKRKM